MLRAKHSEEVLPHDIFSGPLFGFLDFYNNIAMLREHLAHHMMPGNALVVEPLEGNRASQPTVQRQNNREGYQDLRRMLAWASDKAGCTFGVSATPAGMKGRQRGDSGGWEGGDGYGVIVTCGFCAKTIGIHVPRSGPAALFDSHGCAGVTERAYVKWFSDAWTLMDFLRHRRERIRKPGSHLGRRFPLAPAGFTHTSLRSIGMTTRGTNPSGTASPLTSSPCAMAVTDLSRSGEHLEHNVDIFRCRVRRLSHVARCAGCSQGAHGQPRRCLASRDMAAMTNIVHYLVDGLQVPDTGLGGFHTSSRHSGSAFWFK